MLQKIRKKSGSWVIKAILTVIGVSFVVTGMIGLLRIIPPVAKVNGTNISVQEFYEAYRRVLSAKSKQSEGKLSSKTIQKIAEDTLEALVQEVVLEKEPQKLGINVPMPFLKRQIEAMEEFQTSGKFDVAKLNFFLKNSGLKEKVLVENLRKNLIFRQFFSPFVLGTQINDYYKSIISSAISNKKIVQLVYVPENVGSDLKFNENELKRFFEEKKDSYKIDETRKVGVLILDHSKLLSSIIITKQEIELEVSNQPKEEIFPEKRMLYVWKCNSEAEAERVKFLSLKKLRVEEIQKELPNISVEKIGYVAKGSIPKELEDQIFSLEEGGALGPLTARELFVVYSVTEIVPEKRTRIENKILEENAEKEIKNRKFAVLLENTKNMIEDISSEGKSIKEVKLDFHTKYLEIDDFSLKNALPISEKLGISVESAETLIKTAFDLDEGIDSQFIDCSDKSIMVSVLNVKNSHVPELQEVREKVVNDWKKKEKIKRKDEWVREHFNPVAIDSYERWETAIKRANIPVEEVKLSLIDLWGNREKGGIFEFFSDGVVEEISFMKKNSIKSRLTKDGRVAVIFVKDVYDDKYSVLDVKKTQKTDEVCSSIVNDFNSSAHYLLISSVRDSCKVKINKKSFERVVRVKEED